MMIKIEDQLLHNALLIMMMMAAVAVAVDMADTVKDTLVRAIGQQQCHGLVLKEEDINQTKSKHSNTQDPYRQCPE